MSNPAAKANLQRFEEFVSERNTEGDWEDYTLPDKFDLNKKMIARECGFDRKRITGNSGIKNIYDDVVKDLIKKGVLKKDDREPSQRRQASVQGSTNSKERAALKKEKETNAALEEELFQIKKDKEELEKKLKRLEAVEQYMEATGRL